MSEKFEEHDDGMDNTTALSHILDSGDIEEVKTLLGDRDQVRYAGIIRAGIKVPKKSCTKEELALFYELEQQGLPYDEIDRRIGGQPRSKTSKLFPQNVDFLVVRACDFKRPQDADYILNHYADPDGKVRRLPIWLTSSEIDKVLPHSFRSFDGSGNLRAVSYYKCGVLTCRYVPKDIKNPKKEDWKERPCDPDKCLALSGKTCQFGGMFKVNVPGLKTMGNVIIPTGSWNGIKFSCGLLNTVRGLLGRCDGLFKGEPFLELVKCEEMINTPDGKRKQHIITIELAIDPMELARYAETKAERAAVALRLLNGQNHSEPPVANPAPQFPEGTTGAAADPAPSYPASTSSPSEPAAASPDAPPVPPSNSGSVPAAEPVLKYLREMAAHYSLNMEHIHAYAAKLSGGVALEDMPIDDLRTLVSDLKKRAKEDVAKLNWDLQGAADEQMTGTDGPR